MHDYSAATPSNLVTMNITLLPHQIPMVYALLGQGVSLGAVAKPVSAGNAKTDTLAADTSGPSTDEISISTAPAETESDEVDAHGWPWSADMHAATRGQTKDGLWRMKPGVTRPDPKPGFPVTEETPSETSTPSPESPVADTVTEPAGSSPIEEPASADASPEEDEFAAFREAAAKVDAQDVAAAASIPARVWTDADLGALCNQAAVKLGDPSPIKELIAQFVPAGEVAHSRNVPEDKRAEFVAAVEAKAGIEFAG